MSNVKMPEPVKYLYRIKYLGNEVLVEYFSRDDEIIETIRLITTEQAEAYAQAVRDEAEKLSRAKHYGSGHQDGWNSALKEAAEIADQHNAFSTYDAIRALKREQP